MCADYHRCAPVIICMHNRALSHPGSFYLNVSLADITGTCQHDYENACCVTIMFRMGRINEDQSHVGVTHHTSCWSKQPRFLFHQQTYLLVNAYAVQMQRAGIGESLGDCWRTLQSRRSTIHATDPVDAHTCQIYDQKRRNLHPIRGLRYNAS